jgi:hypothetical protein
LQLCNLGFEIGYTFLEGRQSTRLLGVRRTGGGNGQRSGQSYYTDCS